MEEDEALALCDLSPEQQRAHPRYVSPEQAIPDGAAAVVRLLETPSMVPARASNRPR
jgi:hypothetical protein